MLEQRVDRHLVALYDIENTRGEAGFLQKARHVERGGRITLAGFQHEGVAAGDGDRKHPRRHHAWEGKWCDSGGDAERLPQGPVVEAGGDLVGEITLEE